MTKRFECGKSCLKAGEDKMLYNESINVYTPKVYLFLESEEAEWTEVDRSEVPFDEELSDAETLSELMEVLA